MERAARPCCRWIVFVLVAIVAMLPRHAMAASCTASPSGATLNVAGVTVSTDTAVGTKLGTPATVSVTVTCSLLGSATATIQMGNLAPRDASDPPAGGGISFATNVPGIALVLTASPVQASDNSCLRCGPGSSPGWEAGSVTGALSGSTTVTFTGQFMKTGNVTPGTVTGIQLAQMWWYIYGSTASVGPISTLSLAPATIGVQACKVNAGSANLAVVLPTVSTQALKASGNVAGRTPFNIDLTCQSGANVFITMSTSTAGTATGTIANAGTASNISVQLLDSTFTPVTFNATKSLGAAPNGTMSLPYFAQYYATGAATAGTVKATATFTLSYQ